MLPDFYACLIFCVINKLTYFTFFDNFNIKQNPVPTFNATANKNSNKNNFYLFHNHCN